MSDGKLRVARNSAACTSTAAASMSRFGSNSSVMLVLPSVLVEVIIDKPGMVENCFSSTLATEAAMVSGDAPGRLAETLMMGMLKEGSAEIGSLNQASAPPMITASHKSVVATGRRMLCSERFTVNPP